MVDSQGFNRDDQNIRDHVRGELITESDSGEKRCIYYSIEVMSIKQKLKVQSPLQS